jgi:hypothetical protein
MRARGDEPLAEKTQDITNTALTENKNHVLPFRLTFLLQKYPDLAAIVEAWPTLPGHIRAAVKVLIQAHVNNIV